MKQDPNPLHPVGSWVVAQNGIPCRSTFPIATKELAEKMASKMNKIFGVNNFSAIQKPLNTQDD